MINLIKDIKKRLNKRFQMLIRQHFAKHVALYALTIAYSGLFVRQTSCDYWQIGKAAAIATATTLVTYVASGYICNQIEATKSTPWFLATPVTSFALNAAGLLLKHKFHAPVSADVIKGFLGGSAATSLALYHPFILLANTMTFCR